MDGRSRTLSPGGRDPLAPVFGAGSVLLALGVGVLVAWLVYLDGLWGHRLQIQNMGPNPALINDLPYVYTVMGLLTALGLILVLAVVRLHMSFDRVLMGMLALSIFGAAVPFIYQGSLFLIGLVILSRGLRRGRIPMVFTATAFPLGLILISYATTLIYSAKAGAVLPNMFFRGTYMALLLVLPSIVRTRRQLEILLHYIIIMAVVSAAVAAAQFFLSFAAGNPVSFAPSNAAKTTTPFGFVARATGLMKHPNHCAQTLASMTVLTAFFASRPRELISPARRRLYLAVAAFLAFGTFLTFSRSGWLSLGTCLMLLPMVRWPRIIPYYTLGVAAVAAGFVESGLAEFLYTTVKNFNASSVDFRWMEDQVAIQGFFASPIIGQGVQGSTKFFNAFNLQVHNSYLQVLAEMGLFGVLSFGVLFFWIVGRLIERLFHARHPIDRDWLIGLSFCLGITMVQGFFTLFLWIRFTWFVLALLETVILISKAQATGEEPADLIFLQPPAPRRSSVPVPAFHGA